MPRGVEQGHAGAARPAGRKSSRTIPAKQQLHHFDKELRRYSPTTHWSTSSLFSPAVVAMSLSLSRTALLRRSHLFRQQFSTLGRRQASTVDVAKEKASEATSKASEGLSKVQSTAGSVANRAGNAVGGIGGRIGGLVGAVQCEHLSRCPLRFFHDAAISQLLALRSLRVQLG